MSPTREDREEREREDERRRERERERDRDIDREPPSDNWREWSKRVLWQLEQQSQNEKLLFSELRDLQIEIATLKAKMTSIASAWAIIVSGVVSVATGLITYWITRNP